MRFEQTRDILQHQVIEYHHKVGQIYEEFAAEELGARNRLMLDYLIDHERRLALAIHDFMADTTAKALDYWFKRIEIPFPVPDGNILTDACRTDLDQLVGAAIQYKKSLIAFYDHLVQQCDESETTNLFQTLKNQEEKGMKRFIRQSQGLEDL
ncbi:MAG: aminoglycoside phosphotransferase [Geobacteraceae bacterium]|nr:aminoglycoside phosphotransferase [Geobacteraceae bacterium]NTW81280.1 aminoglycoside phosphotransferase [Geobacteraceae bacterium]